MKSERPVLRIVSITLFLLFGGISGFAQNGKLNVHVTPKQASESLLDFRLQQDVSRPRQRASGVEK